MSPEDLMRDSDTVLVEMHVENVFAIQDTASQRTPLEQTKLLGAVAFTARRMHATLKMKRQTQAEILANARAIKASTMKAQAGKAANENQTAAHEEQEMDDDSGRTPERVAALHAELQRRLAALAARREGKSLAREHGLVGSGAAVGGTAESAGGASAPAR